MLADSELAAGPLADLFTVGVPIIVEVTRPGKELIFVVEIDLIQPVPSAPVVTTPTGVLAAADTIDIAAMSGSTTSNRTGSLVTTEAVDVFAASGDVIGEGALAVTEAPDVFAAAGTVATDYTANPVNFDGTNDYLLRGGALTGLVDGKVFLFSAWIRVTGGAGTQRRIFSHQAGGTVRLGVLLDTSNRLWILARDGSNADVIDAIGVANAVTDGNWHFIMISIDLANAANRVVEVDGVAASITWTTYVDSAIDFAQSITPNTAIGAAVNATFLFPGDMADMQFRTPATYFNPATGGNRALFISGGSPVDPATAEASLGTARVLLTGATAGWNTNAGSGGGFTENGALTDGAVPLP